MTENNIDQISANGEVDRIDRIPLKLRNQFQFMVLSSLINDKLVREDDTEEIKRFGKIMSDYIDHTKNHEIRELILKGEVGFPQAVSIMLEEIHNHDLLLAA